MDPRVHHPANALTRDLWCTGRVPSLDEVAMLLARVAEAEFNEKLTDVFPTIIGEMFQGSPPRPREPSLRAHLAKRVLFDGQWSDATTEQQYLDDLRQVARHDAVILAIYRDEKRIVVAAQAPTVVPADRLGPNALRYTLTISDTGRGKLLTGYQTDLIVPAGVQWSPRA